MLKLQACEMTKAIIIKYEPLNHIVTKLAQYWQVGLQITGFCDYKREHNRGLISKSNNRHRQVQLVIRDCSLSTGSDCC